jgi:hypothetical protein
MRRMRRAVWFPAIFLTTFAFGVSALGEQKAGSVNPVPPEKLGVFLKDLSGWKAEGPPKGELVKTEEGTYSESTRYYVQGDKELEVTLTDGAHVPVAFEDYYDWKEELDSRSLDVVKAAQVAGHQAIEIYEPDFETVILLVLVEKRLLLFMEMDEAGPKDDLKVLASQLDWNGIAKLVQEAK